MPICCTAIQPVYGRRRLDGSKKVTYQYDHRSKHKYYLRLVHDIIDIAINNAGIVLNILNESNAEKLDSMTFRRVVAQAMNGSYSSQKRSIPSSSILTPNRAK